MSVDDELYGEHEPRVREAPALVGDPEAAEAPASDDVQETPPPAEGESPASAGARPGIAYNDRVLTLGVTTSGKSELLNVLFTSIRCQKLLVDSKDEFAIAGVEAAHGPDALDWSAPVLHYVPERDDPDEYNELFARCFTRRHLVVAVHELADTCDHQPSRAPERLRKYVSQGARHGLGLLAGSQRPVEIPKRARTEAQHVFVFVPEMDPDDHGAIAQLLQLAPAQLSELVHKTQDEHGLHSFLWFNKRTRELSVWGPLPEHVRQANIVTRRTVA